ncbi:MAG TPA: winged helix-turn-helix transcriptional regulator, partial [Candidatus Hydrogenedentes bacterium]|nr:winged helix-turn-helix transcriptional regulator [Candidatus Hydrogenedentota bacterium]
QTRLDFQKEGRQYVATPGETLVERMVKQHHRGGRAAGGGFYDYPEGGKKHLWPELQTLFEKPNVTWDLQDVKDRLLYRQAVETARRLLDLSTRDRDRISGLGRAAASAFQIHRALMEHPIATSGSLSERTGLTPATVNKTLGHLQRLGIVRELTSQKRNRLFSYTGYITIMNRGTEPPDGNRA